MNWDERRTITRDVAIHSIGFIEGRTGKGTEDCGGGKGYLGK